MARADVRAGSAEELPVDDGDVDVVIGAQMWHWVDLGRATAEVARVLRHGGTFGLLWNLRDERVPWMAELGSVFGGEDVHRHAANVALPPGSPFTATAARDFRWSQELAPTDVVDLVATRSHVQVLPDAERVRGARPCGRLRRQPPRGGGARPHRAPLRHELLARHAHLTRHASAPSG